MNSNSQKCGGYGGGEGTEEREEGFGEFLCEENGRRKGVFIEFFNGSD